ncbi:recombinase family protein [Gordonia sp. DT218]|uniref:recombinase family protein n=1 Tax=Gordonia sp. DT218 TaxID=3416659 RepID=UPI003CFAD3C5
MSTAMTRGASGKSTARAEALRRALAERTQPAAAAPGRTPEADAGQVPTVTKAVVPQRVIGYVRVSTQNQHVKGYGLRAQQEYLQQWCQQNGHQLLTVTSDVMSGGKAEQLHGRAIAINALEADMADVLLVRALDRATRDQLDAAQLFKRAEKHGWRLMDCDGADSGEPGQRLVADVRVAVAAEERRRISQRTKEGLARARREGKRIGRPSTIDPLIVQEIIYMHQKERLGPNKICAWLDENGIGTPGGGYRWYPSTIRRLLDREMVS